MEHVLIPAAQRVNALDAQMRTRLRSSLDHLAEVVSAERGDDHGLGNVGERLQESHVSPWVFALYAKLVAEISRDESGDHSGTVADIARAASRPGDEGLVALRDARIPPDWWDQFGILFDTDRDRPFSPAAPTEQTIAACRGEIDAALSLLERVDPEWREEIGALLRMIVLASPRGADPADQFGGASTFFLWGGSLLNASARRSVAAMLDLLVHESSHVLLFGLSAEGALTRNDGAERYASPLRQDPRPIDGILHACFVATRVHLAMERLLESGMLTTEQTAEIVRHRNRNGRAAYSGISTLREHAVPTARGEEILGALQEYWEGPNPA